MNEWIELKEWNVVFSIKYGRENVVEFYSDICPIYSNKFIYDKENMKVKGAEGYCILTHEEHEKLLNEQSNGKELRYNGSGQIILYEKQPIPEGKKFYKIDYNYTTETWIETATDKEKAQIDYDEYSLLDTPRYNRLMTSKNLIEDYDNYMNNLFSFLNDKEVKTLPKPSSNLSVFKIEMIG